MHAVYERKINMPDYAMPYLINGDNSGLTEEDIQIIDRWFNRMQRIADNYESVVIIGMPEDGDEGSFCSDPEFGLACNCFEITITMLKQILQHYQPIILLWWVVMSL